VRARRALVVVAALAAALAAPASALGHAALLSTTPRLGETVESPPPFVQLVYSEPVEPRFAIVSVTNVNGTQVTTGPPQRPPGVPTGLEVPLRHLPEGWYLVFWRVISADGHPVRGAFTFAVGPSPGPQPQFVIPSLSETAATTPLIAARWASLIGMMAAVGLLAFRLLVARPLARRMPGASLRPVTVAAGVAFAVALVAVPLYLDMTTAQFALRSAFSVSALVPLVRASSFGRAWVDLEIVLAILAVVGAIAIWLDRPERGQRSVVALLSLIAACVTAVVLLVVPGLAGHPAQTSPAALSLALDAVHLLAGSLWIGGLVGLLVLWLGARSAVPRAYAWVVPRFSNVALVSVALLIATGTWAAIIHLPTLGSLWQTSYGEAILVKVALLLAALALASVNLRRNTPLLRAARDPAGDAAAPGTTRLLQRLVGGEVVFVAAAIAAAATLTSLPPPSSALGKLGSAAAHVGPGAVSTVVTQNGYKLQVGINPNRAALPNDFAVTITRGGKPVRGAQVTARFDMLDMDMAEQSYLLTETSPGTYRRTTPALVMVGHWGLTYDVQPRGGAPFSVTIVDRANG
jgi:copper transport protein